MKIIEQTLTTFLKEHRYKAIIMITLNLIIYAIWHPNLGSSKTVQHSPTERNSGE